MYQYTHLTWREINEDGTSNCMNIIRDKKCAADEIRRLALTPGVFALRFIHHGEEPTEDTRAQAEATEFHTRIGPPVTD